MSLTFWKSSLTVYRDPPETPKWIRLPKPFKLCWLRHGIFELKNFFSASLEWILNGKKLCLHWHFPFCHFFFWCLCFCIWFWPSLDVIWLPHGQYVISLWWLWWVKNWPFFLANWLCVSCRDGGLFSDKRWQRIWSSAIFVCAILCLIRRQTALWDLDWGDFCVVLTLTVAEVLNQMQSSLVCVSVIEKKVFSSH